MAKDKTLAAPLVAIGGWQDVKMGDFARDRISGLTGTVVERVIFLYGCDHIYLEGEARDGKLGERFKIPVERAELLRSQPDFHRNEDISTLHVKLGWRVRDKVTGIEGTVTMIHILLYGMMQVSVDPDYNVKEGKLPDAYFIDADRVAMVKEQAPPTPDVPKVPAAKPKAKERGGPSIRITSDMRR